MKVTIIAKDSNGVLALCNFQVDPEWIACDAREAGNDLSKFFPEQVIRMSFWEDNESVGNTVTLATMALTKHGPY